MTYVSAKPNIIYIFLGNGVCIYTTFILISLSYDLCFHKAKYQPRTQALRSDARISLERASERRAWVRGWPNMCTRTYNYPNYSLILIIINLATIQHSKLLIS